MASIGKKDTTPELVVRKALHRLGYRYRIHRKDLPGTPDIAFPSRRKVIFVHGCFWHAHGCKIGRPPRSNISFWKPKLDRNKERDQKKELALKEAGWDVMTVWECETRDMGQLTPKLMAFLDGDHVHPDSWWLSEVKS